MLRLHLPNLDIDADITFNEKGMSLEVKKFNINNFTIDKVFKHIDKLCGKTKKNKDENKKLVDNSSYKDNSSDEYLIEIQ